MNPQCFPIRWCASTRVNVEADSLLTQIPHKPKRTAQRKAALVKHFDSRHLKAALDYFEPVRGTPAAESSFGRVIVVQKIKLLVFEWREKCSLTSISTQQVINDSTLEAFLDVLSTLHMDQPW